MKDQIKTPEHLQIIKECKFKFNKVKNRWEYLIYKHITTNDTLIILSIAYDPESLAFMLVKHVDMQRRQFAFWEEQTPLQINNSSDVVHLKKLLILPT